MSAWDIKSGHKKTVVNLCDRYHIENMIFREFKDFLRFDVRLALSRYHLSRQKVEKARQYLDEALAEEQNIPPYVLAYDARLMTQEDRHFEARDRLRECLNALPKVASMEETYVSHYCRLMMAIYDINCGYEELEEMRQKTASLDADWHTKLYLPIGSKSRLFEQCGYRNPTDQMFRVKNGPTKPSRVYYRADF